MSKVRGVFPLFLATTFGIINGIWVFGPAFKEQQENDGQVKQEMVALNQVDSTRVEELRNVEVAVSRASAAQSLMRPVEDSKPWWKNLDVWGKGSGKDVVGRDVLGKEVLTKKETTPKAPTSNDAQHAPKNNDRGIPTTIPPTVPTGTDTIVHKLADQSAQDADLKVLLKKVADGGASQEEVKKFQNYLDEIK